MKKASVRSRDNMNSIGVMPVLDHIQLKLTKGTTCRGHSRPFENVFQQPAKPIGNRAPAVISISADLRLPQIKFIESEKLRIKSKLRRRNSYPDGFEKLYAGLLTRSEQVIMNN